MSPRNLNRECCHNRLYCVKTVLPKRAEDNRIALSPMSEYAYSEGSITSGDVLSSWMVGVGWMTSAGWMNIARPRNGYVMPAYSKIPFHQNIPPECKMGEAWIQIRFSLERAVMSTTSKNFEHWMLWEWRVWFYVSFSSKKSTERCSRSSWWSLHQDTHIFHYRAVEEHVQSIFSMSLCSTIIERHHRPSYVCQSTGGFGSVCLPEDGRVNLLLSERGFSLSMWIVSRLQ